MKFTFPKLQSPQCYATAEFRICARLPSETRHNGSHFLMKLLKPFLLLLALAPALHAEVSETKLALAREVIVAMRADKMFDTLGPQLQQMAIHQAGLPDSLTPEQRAKAEEFIGKIMELTLLEAKAMIGKMEAVYADVYSEEELRAIVAFFTSPAGQSMLDKQPELMNRVMPLAQEMQRSLIPQIQALTEAFKAEITPDDSEEESADE